MMSPKKGASSGKLGKMKMPPARQEDDFASEFELEEPGEEPAEEGSGEGSMPEEVPGSSDLASFSDDELLAELKKRGVTAELESESGELPPDDEAAGESVPVTGKY